MEKSGQPKKSIAEIISRKIPIGHTMNPLGKKKARLKNIWPIHFYKIKADKEMII